MKHRVSLPPSHGTRRDIQGLGTFLSKDGARVIELSDEQVKSLKAKGFTVIRAKKSKEKES